MKIQLWKNDDHVILRTKTGLAVLPTNVEQHTLPFYCSNIGEFRRYMSFEESSRLPFEMVRIYTPLQVELPEKWRFLWSWKVSDFTEWKAETCCNGGDYAFHEQHNIFGRMNGDKLELLDVIRHTTSAEFRYDEANGSFQSSGLANARFIDCENSDFMLCTQTGSYDENGYPQDMEYSLNQFGQPISWQDAIYYADDEIGLGSWDSPDTEDHIRASASPGERHSRLQILKDTFNWEPPKRR